MNVPGFFVQPHANLSVHALSRFADFHIDLLHMSFMLFLSVCVIGEVCVLKATRMVIELGRRRMEQAFGAQFVRCGILGQVFEPTFLP